MTAAADRCPAPLHEVVARAVEGDAPSAQDDREVGLLNRTRSSSMGPYVLGVLSRFISSRISRRLAGRSDFRLVHQKDARPCSSARASSTRRDCRRWRGKVRRRRGRQARSAERRRDALPATRRGMPWRSAWNSRFERTLSSNRASAAGRPRRSSPAPRSLDPHVVPEDGDLPLVGREQAREQLHERRLAGCLRRRATNSPATTSETPRRARGSAIRFDDPSTLSNVSEWRPEAGCSFPVRSLPSPSNWNVRSGALAKPVVFYLARYALLTCKIQNNSPPE